MGKYTIKCLNCGYETSVDVNQIYCNKCHEKAFLKTFYQRELEIDVCSMNLYRYKCWLPIEKMLPRLSSISGCYKGNNLGKRLGLNNLWILFSGYWPERGAFLDSLTFKEFEAIGVLSRVKERTDKVLIVSSAGNVGRSTIDICLKYDLPAIVVVPEDACSSFLTTVGSNKRPVLLMAIKKAYYGDCIELMDRLSKRIPGIVREGGAYNIARRDFLGIPIIHGINTIGEIPDHYFQAVGSGTGAIAAWETNQRLIGDGRFGQKLMRLNLAQNKPFTPIVDAWQSGKRQHEFYSAGETRERLKSILASVLSNPKPPYSVIGGVFDALSSTNGRTYGVNNREINEAKLLFEETEGIDIRYPSAVAVGALKQAVNKKKVGKNDLILLHITGGGDRLLMSDFHVYPYKPSITLEMNELEKAMNLIAGFIERRQKQKFGN